MPFEPVTVPLLQGANSGVADLSAAARPQSLLVAQNVAFTKAGAIRPRPGVASLDGAGIQYYGSSSVPTTFAGLATPSGVYQPAGVHKVSGPDGSEILLYQCHGRMFARKALVAASGPEWLDVGPCWSARRQTYGVVRSADNQAMGSIFSYVLDTGPHMTGHALYQSLAAANNYAGFGWYDDTGSVQGPITQPTAATYADGQYTQTSVANDAVFWINSTSGNLYMQRCSTAGSLVASQFTLRTDATKTAPIEGTCYLWAAWDGTNYYVAYYTQTAGQVNVIKVTTGGTVTGPLSYTALGPVNCVSLAVDSVSGKGLLGTSYVGTTSSVSTNLFTLSTLTDLAHQVLQSPPIDSMSVTVGIVAGQGYMAYTLSTSGLYSAPGSSTATWFTVSLTTGACASYYTMYSLYGVQTTTAIQALAGRAVQGVQVAGANPVLNGAYTWALLDVTAPLPTANPVPIAAGLAGTSLRRNRPSSSAVVGNTFYYGAVDGLTFSETAANVNSPQPAAPDRVVFRTIALTLQAAPSVQIGTSLLLGGDLSYWFDGAACGEANWIEEPVVTSATPHAAGTLTANASYSYQAVWTFVDSQGRTIRSVASLPVTNTVGGTTPSMTVVVTTPQLTGRVGAETTTPALQAKVELYASPPSAGAFAPKFFIASAQVVDGFGPTVTFVHAADISAGQYSAELYTSGNVLDDERAPGDRGVAVVGDRIWSASENTLYASHKVGTLYAPAWNQELFTVAVPPQYGSVQGLAALDDKVVAVCTTGVVYVAGPGYDDLGQGSGWSEPSRVYDVGGVASARSVTTYPDGVAFVGQDGLVHTLGRDLVGKPLSLPLWTDADTTPSDLVYVPASVGHGYDSPGAFGPILVYGSNGTLKVMSIWLGQWAEWTGTTPIALVATKQGLYGALSASPFVVQWAARGTDLGASFTQLIRTAPIPIAGELSAWGRVRAVNPVFDTLVNHTCHVRVFADEARNLVMDKSASITTAAEAANWPSSRTPEFRTSMQRASFVEVELSATPAGAEWTALDLWVVGTKDRAPSRNRS